MERPEKTEGLARVLLQFNEISMEIIAKYWDKRLFFEKVSEWLN